MVFSSFTFLSFFLTAVFLLHTAIRNIRARNFLLMLASLAFYAYGEPLYILLLIASVLMNYGLGRWLAVKRSKLPVILAVILNIGLLILYKYTGFLVTSLNSLLPAGAALPVPSIPLPIGISFFTFQILSYVLDVYRGDAEVQYSFFDLLLYVSFFPQLIAGPIVKYHDIAAQLRQRTVDVQGITQGIFRFVCGLSKKILIANGMAYAADALFALRNDEWGLLAAWIAAAAYFFQIYFDFSGYSDMAIGLGKMFGFSFRENFDHPYAASSVQDFWRRWHISLSTWFKEYLYIPLGGNRKGKGRTLLNLYIVFLATGIWHGANWTFLVWGLWHGTFLVLERVGAIPVAKLKTKIPGTLYTLLVALLGFVIFRADDLSQAFAVIAAMFGGGVSGGNAYVTAVNFLSPYYLFLFAAAIIGATPLPLKLWQSLKARAAENRGTEIAFELTAMAGSVLLTLLCLMQLASDSYNPFIYFRF